MKKVIFIFLFSIAVNSFSQEKEEIYTIVEAMPEYPGGIKELMLFIQKNINYPKNLSDKNIGGKVFVKFVVKSTGKVEDIIVLKSGGFREFDEEAVRVMGLMTTWTPGTQNGKPVNVYYNMPISFAPDAPYFIRNVSNVNKDYQESMTKIVDNDIDNALILLNKCIEADPKDMDAVYNRGVAYYYKKMKKESCNDFKTIIGKVDESLTLGKNSKKNLEKYCN